MKAMQSGGIGVAIILAVAGSALPACGSGSTASRPAGAPSATAASSGASVCESAARAKAVLSVSTMGKCKASMPLIPIPCPGSAAGIVINVGGTNYALRVGETPRVLGAQYTVEQMQSICATEPTTSVPVTVTTIAPTTTTSSVANTASCAQAVAPAINASPSPQAATLIANNCDPTDLQAVLTTYVPAGYPAPAQAAQSAVQRVESLMCPANPHTKLCP